MVSQDVKRKVLFGSAIVAGLAHVPMIADIEMIGKLLSYEVASFSVLMVVGVLAALGGVLALKRDL